MRSLLVSSAPRSPLLDRRLFQSKQALLVERLLRLAAALATLVQRIDPDDRDETGGIVIKSAAVEGDFHILVGGEEERYVPQRQTMEPLSAVNEE